MTRLLISVRSAQEAEMALAGGADWIDVKEPNHGPLGGADALTIVDVLKTVAGRVHVSAALGELTDQNVSGCRTNDSGVWNATTPIISGLALVKCGLTRLGTDWKQSWLNWAKALPLPCGPVLVAYAEGSEVHAPTPRAVVRFALEARPAAFLIDTATKNGCTLFDHIPFAQLVELLRPLDLANIPLAIAGSLHFDQIDQVLGLNPAWIAVRGGVCINGRNGLVSAELVERWKTAIVASSGQSCRFRWEQLPLAAGR